MKISPAKPFILKPLIKHRVDAMTVKYHRPAEFHERPSGSHKNVTYFALPGKQSATPR